MKIKRLNLLLYITIALIIIGCINNKPLKKLESNNEYCLIDSEFQIGKISYKMDSNAVKTCLGSPHKKMLDKDFNSTDWIYSDISISFSDNHIYNISTNSNEYKTPSGISVGMSKRKIFTILGALPDQEYSLISNDRKEYQFVNCVYEIYLILKFDDNDILKVLEIGNDLP